MSEITFSDFLKSYLTDTDRYYGTFLDYYEVMWKFAKNSEDILVVCYEDLKKVAWTSYNPESINSTLQSTLPSIWILLNVAPS